MLILQGTEQEGQVNKHFKGTSVAYIECVNVDFKSEREEAFQDLQLDVKGCADVNASFDAYCEPEVMDGANQYQAEGHGLQVGFLTDAGVAGCHSVAVSLARREC